MTILRMSSFKVRTVKRLKIILVIDSLINRKKYKIVAVRMLIVKKATIWSHTMRLSF